MSKRELLLLIVKGGLLYGCALTCDAARELICQHKLKGIFSKNGFRAIFSDLKVENCSKDGAAREKQKTEPKQKKFRRFICRVFFLIFVRVLLQ